MHRVRKFAQFTRTQSDIQIVPAPCNCAFRDQLGCDNSNTRNIADLDQFCMWMYHVKAFIFTVNETATVLLRLRENIEETLPLNLWFCT